MERSESVGTGRPSASLHLRVTRGFAGPRTVEAVGNEITVGRSKEATLRFDPQRDLACSSGIHARFRFVDGQWSLECLHPSGLRILASEGRPRRLAEGERVPVDLPIEVELGKGGPRFEAAASDGPVPATAIGDRGFDDQPVSTIPASMLTEVGRSKSSARILAVAMLALVACVAIVASTMSSRNERPPTFQIEEVQEELLREIEGRLEENEEQRRNIVARARDSVWLAGIVVSDGDDSDGEFVGVGTAWTVGERTLATNAHVALALREALETRGGRLEARRPGSSAAPLRIEVADIHPAYERWERRLKDRFVRRPGGMLEPVGLVTPGDVATLTVLEGSSGAALQLRPLDPSSEVRANENIVAIGFPMQGISGPATQQSTSGAISNVTDPFHLEDASDPALLHHTAFAAGGASGGPMLDADGMVVGLITSINAISLDDGKVVIPTGLNYGTHVGMLHDLLGGRAEEIQEDREPRWTSKLEETVASDEEMLRWMALSAGVSPSALDSAEIESASISAKGMKHGVSFRHSKAAGTGLLVVAIAPDRTNIDLRVLVDDKVFEDTHPDCYPVVLLDAEARRRGLEAVVYASETIGEVPCPVKILVVPIERNGSATTSSSGAPRRYSGLNRLFSY